MMTTIKEMIQFFVGRLSWAHKELKDGNEDKSGNDIFDAIAQALVQYGEDTKKFLPSIPGMYDALLQLATDFPSELLRVVNLEVGFLAEAIKIAEPPAGKSEDDEDMSLEESIDDRNKVICEGTLSLERLDLTLLALKDLNLAVDPAVLEQIEPLRVRLKKLEEEVKNTPVVDEATDWAEEQAAAALFRSLHPEVPPEDSARWVEAEVIKYDENGNEIKG